MIVRSGECGVWKNLENSLPLPPNSMLLGGEK